MSPQTDFTVQYYITPNMCVLEEVEIDIMSKISLAPNCIQVVILTVLLQTFTDLKRDKVHIMMLHNFF